MLLASCNPGNKPVYVKNQYFDIKGYFRADSARMAKSKLRVNKMVMHNGISETKLVRIANWGNELNLFAQSDINKPAWRLSYTIDTAGGLILYKAKWPELRTRKIIIKKN